MRTATQEFFPLTRVRAGGVASNSAPACFRGDPLRVAPAALRSTIWIAIVRRPSRAAVCARARGGGGRVSSV